MTRTRTARKALTALLATALIVGMGTTATAAPAALPAAESSPSAEQAKAAPATAAKPNLWLQLHVGPNSVVAEATVIVTNKAGKVVGRGKANKAGTIIMRVSPGISARNPYLVRTSGGKVRGKAFDGHLELVLTKLGMRHGAHFVDMVTTIASEYVEKHGGSLLAAERRVFRKLGLSGDLDHGHLAVPTYAVHAPALSKHHQSKGGFDGTVRHLVRLMKQGKPFPDFGTAEVERVGASTTRSSTANPYSNAACEAQTLPNPDANSPATVGVYGAMMTAGLVSAYMTKDPSLFLNGVAGMVFANVPGMTNASMLASVQAQLSCISQQIKMVEQTLSLQMSVQDAAKCQANYVKPTWDKFYQPLINAAANNPDDTPTYGLTDPNTNGSLQPVMDQIKTMDTACGDAINSGLFNTQGGVKAAWPTVLAQATEANSAAFTPAALAQLQQFLQYWGNIEYQQSVMMNDWYNYQATVIGKPQTTLQDAAMGDNCQKAASLSDVDANQEASTWCQWQQNIINVWPGDVFSDEVADWDLNPVKTSSPYAISGSAVSAVPGGYGKSVSAWTENPRELNLSTLGEHDLPTSTWKVSNALASYNNQPAQVLAAPYQRYDHRAAPKTFAPSKDQLGGYYNLRNFFIGQLNSTITDDTATPCTENCEEWTLIAADGKTELNYKYSDQACHDQQNSQNLKWYYNYRYVHNAVYSPKPWSVDTSGGTVGGEESSKAHNGSKVCSSSVPAFAWFLARPWTQGGTWPTVPTFDSRTLPANVQMGARGCPASGCTWAITSGAIPGLTMSPSGFLSYTGPASTQSVVITVAAMNTYQVSAETPITVQLG